MSVCDMYLEKYSKKICVLKFKFRSFHKFFSHLSFFLFSCYFFFNSLIKKKYNCINIITNVSFFRWFLMCVYNTHFCRIKIIKSKWSRFSTLLSSAWRKKKPKKWEKEVLTNSTNIFPIHTIIFCLIWFIEKWRRNEQ